MCQLRFDKHAEAIARFITDKGNYANYYGAVFSLIKPGDAGIIVNGADDPIIYGVNMEAFNDSYGVWWDEHYPGEIPF